MTKIICINCGMKKHIGIDDGIEESVERVNLIDHTDKTSKCCSVPIYYMGWG